jgi:hypothetical protein
MARSPRGLIGVILAVLAVTVACSGNSDNGTENQPLEPSISAPATVTSPSQVVRPVDEYLPSVDQVVAAENMAVDLTNACSAKFGGGTEFKFDGSQDELRAAAASGLQDEVTHSGVWGLFVDSDQAEKGYSAGRYGVISWSKYQSSVQENCNYWVRTVQPASVVGGPLDLPDRGPQMNMNDSRWVAAVEEWSKCMADKGYNYQTPIDAISQNVYVDPPTAENRATAVADVDCKVSTNLIGKAVAIQSAYDQEYIQSHREALDEYKQQLADFIAGNVPLPDTLPDVMSDQETP